MLVWRLKSYTLTNVPAFCYEAQAPNCYLFSPLGSDTPLFTNPLSNTAASAPDLALPIPIRRRFFEIRDARDSGGAVLSGVPYYYGEGRSLMIPTGPDRNPVTADWIVPADLNDWSYRPSRDQVAVDPQRGRIMVSPGQTRRYGVWVSRIPTDSAPTWAEENTSGSSGNRPAPVVDQVGAGLTFPESETRSPDGRRISRRRLSSRSSTATSTPNRYRSRSPKARRCSFARATVGDRLSTGWIRKLRP